MLTLEYCECLGSLRSRSPCWQNLRHFQKVYQVGQLIQVRWTYAALCWCSWNWSNGARSYWWCSGLEVWAQRWLSCFTCGCRNGLTSVVQTLVRLAYAAECGEAIEVSRDFYKMGFNNGQSLCTDLEENPLVVNSTKSIQCVQVLRYCSGMLWKNSAKKRKPMTRQAMQPVWDGGFSTELYRHSSYLLLQLIFRELPLGSQNY